MKGGHKIFDHQIGGHKNIAEVLSEIYDPPIPKENGGPLNRVTTTPSLVNRVTKTKKA